MCGSHFSTDQRSFSKLLPGKIGTHSFRKGATTYCTRCGLSKDYVTFRGRWRTGKTQVDTYIDVNRPYPDAVTAACLCGHSGPGMYSIVEGEDRLTSSFLSEKVTPNINRLLGKEFACVLALPVIYAATNTICIDGNHYSLLPEALKKRVGLALIETFRVSSLENIGVLIKKKPLVVNGHGGEVHLVTIDDNETNTSTVSPSNPSVLLNEIRGLHSTVMNMKRRIEELHVSIRSEIDVHHNDTASKLQRLDASVKRIALQPITRHVQPEHQSHNQNDATAKLSKGPRTLFNLWQEFQFGLNGNKPARLFTSHERGQNRATYSLRKVFWDQVVLMVRGGLTSDAAIDRIYSVYGQNKSPTDILRKMRVDRKNGISHFNQ